MITTKTDLKFYLQEDAKANRMDGCSPLKYMVRLFIGSESAHVYKYLKTLRHCEYHCNNTGLHHRILYRYYKVHLHRLGFKYNLRIPENICGYGLSILHIAGCGGCLINAKKVGNYVKLQTGVLLGNTNHSENEKPIIGNNVGFGPGAWIQDFDNKLKNLEPVLRYAGELRIVNDLFRMGCNFKKGCKISSTFDQQRHIVYDDWKWRYYRMFLKACFNKKGQKTEKLKTLTRLCKAFLHLKCHTYKHESMYDVCQGHDTVSLLSLSLVNTATYSEAAIWEKCVNAYSVADFAGSNLYKSINEWQTAKGLSIFKIA